MDTITRERNRAQERLLDAWHDDQRPALVAIRDRVQSALEAISDALDLRAFGYSREQNDTLRALATDLRAATHDALSDLHGRIVREADAANIAADMVAFSLDDEVRP